KNVFLLGSAQTSVMLWEQVQGEIPQLAYRKIKNNSVSETTWIEGSANGSNPCGLVVDGQLLLAYEVKQGTGKPQLKLSTVGI
ncbi:MAG TPA: exo-alpha-sialidase, partial [Haliscomenobacter sp.]|nr:exo-alpha-sialidase [Haliscomenobacter sp.]